MSFRKPKNRVVIDLSVYDKIVEKFLQYPLRETCVILGGVVRDPTDYLVTEAIFPNQSKNTRWTFMLFKNDRIKAQYKLSKKGLEFIGIAHSHPHNQNYWWAAMPSQADAHLQIQNHVPVSIIVALLGNECGVGVTAWREGFPAPLSIFTRKNRRLSSVY